MKHVRALVLALLAAPLALTAASCASSDPAGLVLALTVDMPTPDAVDRVGLEVFDAKAVVVFRKVVPIDAQTTFPLSVALQAGADPRITIHAFAAKGEQIRILREAIVRVPKDSVKVLPVGLQGLCDGRAAGVLGEQETRYSNACGDGRTCFAGGCIDSNVNLDGLPSALPEPIPCLDVDACFRTSAEASVDPSNCSIPLPPGDPARLNVGVEVPGACGAGKPCSLPLPVASMVGFRIEGDRALLPAGVCEALADKRVSRVVTASCEVQQTAFTPRCAGSAPPITIDAGGDGGSSNEAGFNLPDGAFDAGTDAASTSDAPTDGPGPTDAAAEGG